MYKVLKAYKESDFSELQGAEVCDPMLNLKRTEVLAGRHENFIKNSAVCAVSIFSPQQRFYGV